MRKLALILTTILFLCLGCFGLVALLATTQNQVVAHQFPLSQKWAFEADKRIESTPVVDNDQVFVRTDQELYAFNAKTGELHWSVLVPNLTPAPPVVQDGIVVVSHDGGSSAFNATTGKLLWQVSGDRYTRADAFPAVATDDIVVFVDYAIFVRDLKTGDLLWEVQNPYARSDAIVAVDNDYLYVVFEDQIHSYDLRAGELVWNNPTEEWSLQSGILADTIFYLKQIEGGISAYDLGKLKTVWKRKDLYVSDYPMAKYENALFVGLRGNTPIALDSKTGKTLWQAEELNDNDNYQTPLVLDDIVYIRGLFLKRIYALDKQTGQLIGYIKLGLPDIISNNASYSLGPVQYENMIIFPAGKQLLGYGR